MSHLNILNIICMKGVRYFPKTQEIKQELSVETLTLTLG